MAGAIGLVVKIAADTGRAVREIKDVDDALRGTGRETDKASTLMGKLGGVAKGAAAGVAAVGGAAVAAAAAMVHFGRAAWEDHQEAQKLAFTLSKMPGITQDMIDANEAWITQTMFATHIVDTDLRVAVGRLATATGDLAKAQQLAALAADVAVGREIEYAEAVSIVEKAVQGKTGSLMRQMPWLDANKDGAISAAEALDGLGAAYGGAAAEAAKNDPWTTMQLIWDEIKESLGQWIIPLFERLGEWFKNPVNQAKIQTFIDKLGSMSFELGQKLLPYLERFLDYIESPEGQKAMKDFAQTAGRVAEAFLKIGDGIATVVNWWGRLPDWMKSSGINLFKFSPDSRNLPAVQPAGRSVLLFEPPAGRRSAAPAGTGARARAAGGIVINFNVPVDPEGAARSIRRVLEDSSARNHASARRRVTAGDARW
jgi:hypothetical protein